jgi:hypothetical protein
VRSASKVKATTLGDPEKGNRWAPNTTQMPAMKPEPVPTDPNPIKPPFDMENWFTGNPSKPGEDGHCKVCGQLPSGGTFPSLNPIYNSNVKMWDPATNDMVKIKDVFPETDGTVHGFGAVGTPIPPQRAGELVLTAYPNASTPVKTVNGETDYELWMKDKDQQKLFGLPPEKSNQGPYGIADPTTNSSRDPNSEYGTKYGGYQFVKNGFPNESSVGGSGRLAPTRCVSDMEFSKDGEPRINCLNFSMNARQPFQLSVILYDQLGNFVTQYREVVTEREFRSVVQGPNYTSEEKSDVEKLSRKEDDKCKAPTTNNFGQPDVITTNGLVKVNVNIYPFSKDGRRFGNGVYIAKIDRVDLPYGGCVNNEGTPVYTNEDYKRYHADQKFGWMRTKPSKK